MKRARAAVAGIGALLAAQCPTPATPILASSSPEHLTGIAADGGGRIYAYSSDWKGKLAVFADGRWREFHVGGLKAAAVPRKLLKLRDGRILSAWHAGEGRWLLVRFASEGPAGIEDGSWEAAWPGTSGARFSLTEDHDGGCWLSGELPELARVDSRDGSCQVFSLSGREGWGSGRNWNPAFVLPLGPGETWVWTSNAASNHLGLAQPLRHAGASLAPVSNFPAAASHGIEQILPAGPEAVWVLTSRSGLLRVNTRTGQFDPVPTPQRHTIRWLLPCFDTWLGMTWEGLWMMETSGWRSVASHTQLPLSPAFGNRPASAQLPQALLIATDRGLAEVRRDGSLAMLDWRRGFPIERIAEVVAAGAHRFAVLAYNQPPPRWLLARLDAFPSEAMASRAEEYRSLGPWVVDSQDRIFTMLEREGEGLDVFDNGGWARIGLPDGVWRSRCEIGLDESGRLRIVPANDRSKTAVWSEGGHWQPASPPEPRAEERTDRKPAPALPKDFRPSNLRHWRMVRDNHGMLWVAGEGRLFKYWRGRTVEVFGAGEAHPFLASPPLESARVDRWGNSWLALGQWRHVRIPPQARPPFDPRVQVEESGLARIEGAEGLQISWRPAGEARWIEASEGLLGFLPPGRARFEVRGLDDRLNFHGPVGREVLVKASSQEQVAELIGVLRRGPDTLRVAAVEALAQHGESARAALEEASRQATHWWIEAALEEIKRRKAAELQTDGAARSSAI